MSSNQPSQPTAPTRFLYHTLWSIGVGVLLAVLTAIGQYIYTAGDSIDIKVVITVGTSAFLAYLLAHFKSDIQPNWAQISQGISDVLTQSVQQSVTESVQTAHAPLYNAVGQLQQQVAQIAAVQPAVSGKYLMDEGTKQLQSMTANQQAFAERVTQQPAPLPISQLPTQDMPVVIASQPWQPPDPSVHFDTGVVPVVAQ